MRNHWSCLQMTSPHTSPKEAAASGCQYYDPISNIRNEAVLYKTPFKCSQMVTVALSIIFSYWRYSGIGSFEQTISRELHTHIIVSNIKFCFSPDKFNSTEMAVLRRKYKGHEPVYVQNVISPVCLFVDVADILARWHHRRLLPLSETMKSILYSLREVLRFVEMHAVALHWT
jgi:hypothetical protein